VICYECNLEGSPAIDFHRLRGSRLYPALQLVAHKRVGKVDNKQVRSLGHIFERSENRLAEAGGIPHLYQVSAQARVAIHVFLNQIRRSLTASANSYPRAR